MDTPTDSDFLRFVEPVEHSPPATVDESGLLFSLAEPQMLTVKDICSLMKVSRSTLYSWLEQGHFPRPVRVGRSSVRWFADDLEEWRKGLARVEYSEPE